MDKLEKGCPKSRTTCIENRGDSDNEFLLADKTNVDSSPEHERMSNEGTTNENVTIMLNDCKKNRNDIDTERN